MLRNFFIFKFLNTKPTLMKQIQIINRLKILCLGYHLYKYIMFIHSLKFQVSYEKPRFLANKKI